MLRSSSNRAVSSTMHRHLLVALGGALQAGDERRSDAGPIERLLDGQDVGIVGGLRQERDHRVVRVVGMMQQHVALVQHREKVALLARPGRRPAAAADRAARRTPADPRGPSARASREDRARRRRRRPSTSSCRRIRATSSCDAVAFHLEPDDIAAAAAAQLALDELELRATALVVELQLGVAGQPNDRRLQDRLSREELRQMRANDLLEQHERDALGARRAARAG